MKTRLLCGLLPLLMFVGCVEHGESPAIKTINTQSSNASSNKEVPYIPSCFSVTQLNARPIIGVNDSTLRLPIGDSIAFFHDFGHSWDNYIQWTDPVIEGDSISDHFFNRLSTWNGELSGKLWKTDCYQVLLKDRMGDKSRTHFFGQVLYTVSPQGNLIDSLPIRTYFVDEELKAPTYVFSYISTNRKIFLKTFRGSYQAEMLFFDFFDQYKVLPNGIFSPIIQGDGAFHQRDTVNGLDRVREGFLVNGTPHGKWQIIQQDFSIPYQLPDERYIHYTLTAAEGEYHYGLKEGTWNYWSVAQDTVVSIHGYPQTVFQFKKGQKLLRKETYENGLLLSQEDLYSAQDYVSLRPKMVHWPKRFLPWPPGERIGTTVFPANKTGILIFPHEQSRKGFLKIDFDSLWVLEEEDEINKNYPYKRGLATKRLKVKSNVGEGYINFDYFSPFPLVDTAQYGKLTLSDYAELYPTVLKELEPKRKFLFKGGYIAEVYLFLRHLKNQPHLYDWYHTAPIAEGYVGNGIKNISIKAHEVSVNYEVLYALNDQLWLLDELTYHFEKGRPYSKVQFVQKGEDVEVTFDW